MTLFNGAQSFFLDPSIVAQSTTMDLAAVGMFFMYRPSATNNRSGIQNPGITMFVTDVINGVPNMSNTQIFTNTARVEWNAVATSSDASVETIFSFANPVKLITGRAYAFCWAYDGGEDFLPWTNIKGNFLVSTSQASPGPSSQYGGNYFLFSSVANASATSIQNYQTAWTPLSGTDAKFKLYAARYAINSIPIFANLSSIAADTPVYTSNLIFEYISNTNSVDIIKPAPRVENIVFDIEKSLKQTYVGAQRVYQNTIHWPGGGVWASVATTGANTVTANAQLSNGATFSWNTVFGGFTGDKFVVIDYGTSVDVRQVVSIISNTVIKVDEGTTVVNAAAKIMISPVAVTDSFNASFLNGKRTSLMFMRDSSANSSVRFVGHSLDFSNVTFSNTGTGYSNNDILYVVGYSNVNNVITDNYPAVANLSTNSTGGVIALNWSNVGSGFVNTAQTVIVVSNAVLANPNVASPNTSAGANLVPVLNFGTTLLTEQTNNIFRNSRPVNIDVHSLLAAMTVAAAPNTTATVTFTTQYYLANNTLTPNGYCTYVGAYQNFNVSLNTTIGLNTLADIPVVASRSLEFGIHYSNGTLNDQISAVVEYSNNYFLKINTKSTNDYVALGPVQSPLLDFSRYIFNNDYTNENTDSGNALARHITTVFNLNGPTGTNQMAEDLRFYVSAWRPSGTDIQVYARIQNSTDEQPFSDEDWTRMTLIEGSNNFSTSGYTDLTFGFQGQPNTTIAMAGTVTTTNNNANVVGSNTSWGTIANNTLVKIYDPLFANTNFVVCLVTNAVNSSFLTLDQVFCTNTALGMGGPELAGRGGLQLDVLGYGHQGFNNNENDNVVRYYNQSEHVYDGFNILQMKLIMMSSDAHNIPRIHNIRGIGVSA